jgi:NAD(P)-dependent dehydrogenase (short-subunit alcohol dehydrogenase family)
LTFALLLGPNFFFSICCVNCCTIAMPGRLESKVAIITGGSSGIGRAISLTFAREGAAVVCGDLRETSRKESENEPTHQLIQKNGGKAIFVKCDTSKAQEVEALVHKAVHEYGRVDIMINNAGIAIESTNAKPIWELDEETWDTTMAINAKGVMLGCKYAAIQMMKQDPHPSGDRGWIVNSSSIVGLVGSRNTSM